MHLATLLHTPSHGTPLHTRKTPNGSPLHSSTPVISWYTFLHLQRDWMKPSRVLVSVATERKPRPRRHGNAALGSLAGPAAQATRRWFPMPTHEEKLTVTARILAMSLVSAAQLRSPALLSAQPAHKSRQRSHPHPPDSQHPPVHSYAVCTQHPTVSQRQNILWYTIINFLTWPSDVIAHNLIIWQTIVLLLHAYAYSCHNLFTIVINTRGGHRLILDVIFCRTQLFVLSSV